jgi:hypothetical protein
MADGPMRIQGRGSVYRDVSVLRERSPWWIQPPRWFGALAVSAYYGSVYRIRGWNGRLPVASGPRLVIANHQHEIESAAIVAALSLSSFSWRYPIFTVSSRRMWEPGFLAERLPWMSGLLRNLNFGPLFSKLGLQPIENDLYARPFASFAMALTQRHGDAQLSAVFRQSAIDRLPPFERLSDLLRPESFAAARGIVALSEINEPYRREAMEATRQQLHSDIANFETLQREGATIFLTPEGFYTGDGKMRRLRGVLARLVPLANVFLVGISYDPFVAKRLSLLYRLAPALPHIPLDMQLKSTRPVTVSALLAAWLRDRSAPFHASEAIDAVRAQLAALPGGLFVDPELERRPGALTAAALKGLLRLGSLRVDGERCVVTERRTHPHFPRTNDMIDYQANFHEETLAGAKAVAALAALTAV